MSVSLSLSLLWCDWRRFRWQLHKRFFLAFKWRVQTLNLKLDFEQGLDCQTWAWSSQNKPSLWFWAFSFQNKAFIVKFGPLAFKTGPWLSNFCLQLSKHRPECQIWAFSFQKSDQIVKFEPSPFKTGPCLSNLSLKLSKLSLDCQYLSLQLLKKRPGCEIWAFSFQKRGLIVKVEPSVFKTGPKMSNLSL